MTRRLSLTAVIFLTILITCFAQNGDKGELSAEREALASRLFPGDDPIEVRNREAFASVAREKYISGDYKSIAYKNMPVPAGRGLIQPAPEMISSILSSAEINPLAKVLVIGRNTAYLNAIISRLTDTLFIIDPTAGSLESSLYPTKSDLSFFSWVEEAPFNCIILFGSVEEIPQSLVSQLKDNGKIIAPLDSGPGNQMLVQAIKYPDGFSIKSLGESYIHKLQN